MAEEWKVEGLRLIPSHMRDGMTRWIEDGMIPGDFLQAVIRNDLMGALMRADQSNLGWLKGYAMFFANYAPHGSFGSPEAAKKWNAKGGLKGRVTAQ